ncbi:MAG: TatD family hydrolase [Pseudomonadales bacterium]
MIDIGANLAGDTFLDDFEQVLQRARHHGVEQIIVTGSDLESSRRAQALHCEHPDYLFATAGVHPHVARSFNDDSLAALQALLAQPGVVAIGETGLDYNRNFSSEREQLYSFDAHLELAHEINKPLFLHERDAAAAFLERMRRHPGLCERAIVHCFTGNRETLHAYLDMGLSIGVTGWICDQKRGRRLNNIVRDVPITRLMIETDAPYLVPNRESVAPLLAKKHRNEPWTLHYTAVQLAASLAVETQTLIEQTSANARAFFGLPESQRVALD